MTDFNITIHGEVVGKQLKVIRFGRGPNARAGLAMTKQSKSAFTRYITANKQHASEMAWNALACPASVHIRAFIAIRASYSTKKSQALLSGPCSAKPDGDNICKLVLDALVGEKIGPRSYEGLVLIDDNLATDITITNRWCEIGQERLEVTVSAVVCIANLI